MLAGTAPDFQDTVDIPQDIHQYLKNRILVQLKVVGEARQN